MKKIKWAIIGGVICCAVFAILSHIAHIGNRVSWAVQGYSNVFAIIGGIIGVIVGIVGKADNTSGCGGGCGGAIVGVIAGAIIGAIVGAVFFHIPKETSIVIGIIVGVLIGVLIGGKKDEEDDNEKFKQRQVYAREFLSKANSILSKCDSDVIKGWEAIFIPEYKSIDLQKEIWDEANNISLNLQKIENSVEELNAKENK